MPAFDIGQVDSDLAVEAPGPQQRRVEHIGAVGGGDHDDIGVVVEAVHLRKQLVERLLALVVSTAQARAAPPTNRINLIDKDDGGRIVLGFFEQIANARRAHAHEHLHEFRCGDAEEGDIGFASDSARHQGLASARRTNQQHASRHLRADLDILLGLFEEVDYFIQFHFGGVLPGHIVKFDGGHLRRFFARL